MSSDLPQKTILLVGYVFFAVRIVTWPMVAACLLLSKSHQSLPLLVAIVVAARTVVATTETFIGFFWIDDLKSLRRDKLKNYSMSSLFHTIEGALYSAVLMLVAVRLAHLKFLWAAMIVMNLLGLAAMFYWVHEYRVHPEKYPEIESTTIRTTTRRISWKRGILGSALMGAWLYAWRDWIF